MDKVLGDKIPEFNRKAEAAEPGLSGLEFVGAWRKPHASGDGGDRPRRGGDHRRRGGSAAGLQRAAVHHAEAEPDRARPLHRVAVSLAAPCDDALRALRRFRHRRRDRLCHGGGHHSVPVRREGRDAVYSVACHDADAGPRAAARAALRLRQRAAHHCGRPRKRPDGDDQFRDRLPPRRSRRRLRSRVRSARTRSRSSPRFGFQWRCR